MEEGVTILFHYRIKLHFDITLVAAPPPKGSGSSTFAAFFISISCIIELLQPCAQGNQPAAMTPSGHLGQLLPHLGQLLWGNVVE